MRSSPSMSLRCLISLGVAFRLLFASPIAEAKPPAPPTSSAPGKKPAPKKSPPKAKAPTAPPTPSSSSVAWHPPAPATVEAPRPPTLDLAIDKTTLPNGLRVVLNPDPAFPSATLAIAYGAGPRAETRDQEGFAYASARAMAQAPSEQSARARVDQLIGHGAQFNTVTTSDEVMFVDVLPAGALEFGLWLESERLRRGQATDESLQLQRKTARDRDQLALSLSQLGLGRSRLEQLTFEGYWPYEHDPFGAASIAQATLPLLQAFLHDYYVPNNAVLAITGHFNPEEATRAIHRYFDDIPRHPQLPIANPAPLPEQTNQRSATVRSEQTHSSILLLGWAVPAARQPEHDALGMAASILGEGADSRFAQRIARAKLAVSFSVEIDERRGPSLLLVAAQGPSETNLLAARKLIEEEIDALARLGPSTDEMRRLWRQAQTAFLLGLASSDQRAMRLASLELLHGDARLVHAELSRVLSIGKDDIRKAVARLLTPTRRSLVAANQEGRPVDAAATPIPAPHGAVVPASHGPVSAAPTAKPAGKKKPGPAKPDKPASKKKKK